MGAARVRESLARKARRKFEQGSPVEVLQDSRGLPDLSIGSYAARGLYEAFDKAVALAGDKIMAEAMVDINIMAGAGNDGLDIRRLE